MWFFFLFCFFYASKTRAQLLNVCKKATVHGVIQFPPTRTRFTPCLCGIEQLSSTCVEFRDLMRRRINSSLRPPRLYLMSLSCCQLVYHSLIQNITGSNNARDCRPNQPAAHREKGHTLDFTFQYCCWVFCWLCCLAFSILQVDTRHTDKLQKIKIRLDNSFTVCRILPILERIIH